MRVEFEPTGSLEGLQRLLASVSAEEGVHGLIVLAADENGLRKEDLDPLLRSLDLPLMGGVFPQILHGRERHTRGTLVVGLEVEPRIGIVRGLSDADADLEAQVDALDLDPGPESTLLVLVDGLASRISALIEALFQLYGLEPNSLGGGAGSLTLQRRPCLFSNEGLLEDVGLVAHLEARSGVGVAHGWEPLEGPFRVTRHGSRGRVEPSGTPS